MVFEFVGEWIGNSIFHQPFDLKKGMSEFLDASIAYWTLHPELWTLACILAFTTNVQKGKTKKTFYFLSL